VARRKTSASSAPRGPQRGKTLWKLYGRLSAVAAGVLSLRAVNLLWQLATGRKPPATPENPEVTMREAVVWAVLSGAAAQLAKLIVTRRAVDYWVRSTGHLPPGIAPSDITPGLTKKD